MAHLDDQVRDELLTAELNVLYYKALGQRYTRLCVGGAVLLALEVAATFAAFSEGLAPFWLTMVLLLASAVLFVPLTRWKRRMDLALRLEFAWLGLVFDLGVARLIGSSDARVVGALVRKATMLHAADPYPEDRAETRRAQAEVNRQHMVG